MLKTSSGTAVSEHHGSETRRDSDWVRAHEALSNLAKKRAALDAEEGRWMLVALRTAAHVHLGFGSFGEYVERLFGYKPRSTQEKLRVAEALEELPATAAELESGALSWSAVRELTRVATGETEQSWLEAPRGKTVHQLEALVAGKERGATPSSVPRPEARTHVLRFEVAAATLCLFRDAIEKLRRDSGASLDDDAALMLMARHVLGGPADEGHASYQIALSVCPACSQGYQQACGELVPVGADVVAMGECDGQHLGPVPAAKNTEVQVDGAPGQSLEFGAHVGATTQAAVQAHAHAARRRTRAKQSIPPATRRAVIRRDHHRCRVPGCRNHRYLDLHHLQLRSEKGTNQASNLVTLCGVHHLAAHRGELVVTGRVADEVSFRHADGCAYGSAPDPRGVEVRAKAFAALRNLGFRESEARGALAKVGKNLTDPTPSLERLLREALEQLTPSKKAPAR